MYRFSTVSKICFVSIWIKWSNKHQVSLSIFDCPQKIFFIDLDYSIEATKTIQIFYPTQIIILFWVLDFRPDQIELLDFRPDQIKYDVVFSRACNSR